MTWLWRYCSVLFSDSNIELNKMNNEGSTAFMLACVNGHKDVVKLLLTNFRIRKCNFDDFWRENPLTLLASSFHVGFEHFRPYLNFRILTLPGYSSVQLMLFRFSISVDAFSCLLYQLMLFRYYHTSWCFFVLTIKHQGNNIFYLKIGSSPFTTVDALDAPWCSWCFFGTPLTQVLLLRYYSSIP